jgi:hypothetical protein
MISWISSMAWLAVNVFGRTGGHTPAIWNLAADALINAIITTHGGAAAARYPSPTQCYRNTSAGRAIPQWCWRTCIGTSSPTPITPSKAGRAGLAPTDVALLGKPTRNPMKA